MINKNKKYKTAKELKVGDIVISKLGDSINKRIIKSVEHTCSPNLLTIVFEGGGFIDDVGVDMIWDYEYVDYGAVMSYYLSKELFIDENVELYNKLKEIFEGE